MVIRILQQYKTLLNSEYNYHQGKRLVYVYLILMFNEKVLV